MFSTSETEPSPEAEPTQTTERFLEPEESETSGDEEGSDEPILIGVSIMEMTAYTWFLGAVDGCKQWAEEHPEAILHFSLKILLLMFKQC